MMLFAYVTYKIHFNTTLMIKIKIVIQIYKEIFIKYMHTKFIVIQ